MRRIYITCLIIMTLILSTAPNISATDPNLYLQGYVTIDGAPSGSGLCVEAYNVDADQLFQFETNGASYFNVFIGTDAEIGDRLEINPKPGRGDMICYISTVFISQTNIEAGYIEHPIHLITMHDSEYDCQYVFNGHSDDYVWEANLNVSIDDYTLGQKTFQNFAQFQYSNGDFDLAYTWGSHLSTIYDVGGGQFEGGFDTIEYNDYDSDEWWKFTVEQYNTLLNTKGWTHTWWRDDGDNTENMEYQREFIEGAEAHFDPPKYLSVEDTNFNTGTGWKTIVGDWFIIKITLIYHCIVTGEPTPQQYASDPSENTISVWMMVKEKVE